MSGPISLYPFQVLDEESFQFVGIRLRGACSRSRAFALLGELEQPEYELALLVATCGFRISEALGLCWRDILWVHNVIQDGAKTLLSRSRVEVPQLALGVLTEWRKQTILGIKAVDTSTISAQESRL